MCELPDVHRFAEPVTNVTCLYLPISECELPDVPRFAEPVANVTATVGKEALMACVVENLKDYKVSNASAIFITLSCSRVGQ